MYSKSVLAIRFCSAKKTHTHTSWTKVISGNQIHVSMIPVLMICYLTIIWQIGVAKGGPGQERACPLSPSRITINILLQNLYMYMYKVIMKLYN